MNSKLGRLSVKDIIKGVITAIFTSILAGAYSSISAGAMPTTFSEFQPMLITGGLSGMGYLLKNLSTNSNDDFMKSEPAPQIQEVQTTLKPTNDITGTSAKV